MSDKCVCGAIGELPIASLRTGSQQESAAISPNTTTACMGCFKLAVSNAAALQSLSAATPSPQPTLAVLMTATTEPTPETPSDQVTGFTTLDRQALPKKKLASTAARTIDGHFVSTFVASHTELQAPLKHLGKEQTPELLPADDDNIPADSPEGPHPRASPSVTPNLVPCDKESGPSGPNTSIDSPIGAADKVWQPRDLVWAIYVHLFPSGPKTFQHKGRVVAVHDTEVTVQWATDKNHTKVTASEVHENEEAAWAAFHEAQISSSPGSARRTPSENSDTSSENQPCFLNLQHNQQPSPPLPPKKPPQRYHHPPSRRSKVPLCPLRQGMLRCSRIARLSR